MSMEQQSSSSASVSGASHSDVERHNSSPPTSPASSHHSPFPPKQSNPTSPPKEQSVPQLALQAPPAFETVPVDNQVNAYTTATADDAIDPALKDLSNSFPAEPKDLQGQDPALDDFSWLPDFVPNNQSPAAVGSTNRLWPINTEFGSLPSTQPQSSASESPASPFPRRGSADWTGSHNGESATNLPGLAAGSEEKQGKDVGISKNILTSAASSESGFETGRDDGVPLPKKKSHARKQPEGHIKRARNAFILFRKHITDSNLIPPSVEVKHQNISVVAAKMWKEAPQEVRQEFQEKARLEKEEHQRKYPGYRYQPVFRRTDIIRRRVRKDPAEDEKVDAVAEALIKGKAGNDLEKEIKDQLVIKSDTSENESEVSTKSRSRRRREVGQLSKGAVRAQRAQARAKQMRQNLLGSNLLNMSLYNAANARLASSNGANEYHAQQAAAAAAGMAPHGVMNGHPGHTHPGLQCAMDSYMQMGYGMDHRPLQVGGAYPGESYGGIAQGGPASTGVESEMYRLPPIDGMMGPGNGYDWQAPPAEVDYWEQGGAAFEMVPPPQQGYPVGEGYYAARDTRKDGRRRRFRMFDQAMEHAGEVAPW
ncbi:hypothetical protein IAR50_000199 [Cryptococcus sp. DSM 104548]